MLFFQFHEFANFGISILGIDIFMITKNWFGRKPTNYESATEIELHLYDVCDHEIDYIRHCIVFVLNYKINIFFSKLI